MHADIPKADRIVARIGCRIFFCITNGRLKPNGRKSRTFIYIVRYNSGCTLALTKVMNGIKLIP